MRTENCRVLGIGLFIFDTPLLNKVHLNGANLYLFWHGCQSSGYETRDLQRLLLDSSDYRSYLPVLLGLR